MAIQFRCYQCKTLLRLPHASPGQVIRCGRCKFELRLQPPAAGTAMSADRMQMWRTLPPPPPQHAVQADQSSTRFWHDVANETVAIHQANPVRSPVKESSLTDRSFESGFVPQPQAYREDYKYKPQRKRKKSNDWIKNLLAFFAFVMFICCGGFTVLGLLYNPYTARTTLTCKRYTVSAPGFKVEVKNNTQESQGAKNFRTGSQFEIGFTYNATGSYTSLEQIKKNMQSRGIRDISIVNTNGLNGVHYTSPKSFNSSATHEGAIYPINEGLLILVYVNGADLPNARGIARRSGEENRAIDNPERFFDSLTAVGNP